MILLFRFNSYQGSVWFSAANSVAAGINSTYSNVMNFFNLEQINQELTAMHQEVVKNLESIQGALLRMNRSIQAEGTFGIMKNDRWYKRIVRRGIESVRLEMFLVSIGQNLYKFHNKKKRTLVAA